MRVGQLQEIRTVFLSEASVHTDLCMIGMVLGSLGWSQTHFVVKDNSELLILLPPPSKCWDYKCISLCPAQIVHLIYKSYIQSHLLYYSLHICFRSYRNKMVIFLSDKVIKIPAVVMGFDNLTTLLN